MEYFLIVLVLILLVGGRSVKSIRAFRQELSDLENAPETSQPAFESLFATAKNGAKSFADEEKSAGYFTYETDDSSSETQYKSPKVSRPVVQTVVKEEPQIETSAFDLRQAIVYNAILTPKYLGEVGYSDN